MRMKVSDAVFEKGTKEWKEVFEGNHFPLSKNAALVLNERYLLKEGDELIESFEELLKRVASVLASVEGDKKKIKKWTEAFYDVMAKRLFLPGSPTLMNAGRPGKNAFPACFVIDVKDNLAHHRDSIFGAVKQMAGIHKSGGGTGCSFSNLRPMMDHVSSTNGAASGPVSFMHVFNNVIEVVMQGGMRRGAHMSILRVDHPDILEFISCKGRLDEVGKRMFVDILKRLGMDEKHPVAKVIGKVINEYQLRNMNISVGLTREFKKALIHDGVYFLKNPRTGETVKQLKAREVFRKIAEFAHKNGEPGIVDLDRINEDNPVKGTKIESTNPSLVAGTRVLTEDGVFEIQDLENKSFQVPVLTGGYAPAKCFKSGENKEVLEVGLKGGGSHFATPEHKWPVLQEDGSYMRVPTSALQAGDLLPSSFASKISNNGWGSFNEGFLLGWLYADGSMTYRLKEKVWQYGFTFNKEDGKGIPAKIVCQVLEEITGKKFTPKPRQRDGQVWYELSTRNKAFREFCKLFGVGKKEHGLPRVIWNETSEKFRQGFIDALLSADGYIDKKRNRMVLVSAHKKLAYDFLDLMGFYGIKGNIKENESTSSFPNGKDYKKTYKRFDVTFGLGALNRFKQLFSLQSKKKGKLLNGVPSLRRNSTLLNHIPISFVKLLKKKADKVWDIIVDNPSHTFAISRVFTGNCGEQPLEAWESCNLGSVVLNEHIKCVNGTKEMDWDKFKNTVAVAVRMLDNVIDATPFPYPHIEEKTKLNRKIGLGVMGLADVMIELGIAYDSQEGVEFCKLVHSKLTLYGREASAELAKEKGEFPAFKDSVFATGKPDEIKYRNATVTTIAPTGTISTIADCSPAIEPIFKLAYKRNVLDGKTLYVINPKFQEIAKELRFDYPDIMQEVAETGSCRGVEGVPEDVQKLFATALDVSPEYHVDILCAAQGHLRPLDPDGVENAVSKTLNLPFEATVEDVEDAFARALKGGAKGATVYRSGSRDMEVFASMNAVRFKSLVAKKKRPKQKMNAQNYRMPLPCGDFYFTVVPDENGRPFEVFFSPEHKMDCVDSGMTQLCRQISLSLRCGVGIEDIVNQHLGVRCTKCEGGIGFGEKKIFSCWDALAKVLMEYMECSDKRNEMIQKNLARVLFGICPECKSELVSAGGTCRTCPNCKKYYTCL